MLVCYWSRIKNKEQKLLPTFLRYIQMQQEVGGDLSLCLLKLLPEVSILSRLVAISFTIVEIKIFPIATWSQVIEVIKGSYFCKGGNLSEQVTNLPSFVSISVLIVLI